jgi:hypothetical protein
LIANAVGEKEAVVERVSPGWPVTTPIAAWLDAPDPERDVEGAVLRVAAMRTGLEVAAGFQVTAIRRKTPEIPFTSLPEMFGWE